MHKGLVPERIELRTSRGSHKLAALLIHLEDPVQHISAVPAHDNLLCIARITLAGVKESAVLCMRPVTSSERSKKFGLYRRLLARSSKCRL